MTGIAPAFRWPADLSAERFLRDYWQKEPLLIRDALPGFRSPLSADELAWLAGCDDVESRLVLEAGEPPWQLREGPFNEQDFAQAGDAGWSLLVQDVEKHLPELAEIADRFDFIPAWRLDDLMVSFAPPGGSVGAHIDAYDVFLLQGQGLRTWSIGACPAAPKYHPDAELRLLTNFQAEVTWTLSPGDALYLPPGVAHHGVAGADCLTWSVGFRAPSHRQIIDAAGLPPTSLPPDEALYEDPDLCLNEAAPGLLSDAAIERANGIVGRYCAGRTPQCSNWFGELVTAPKEWLRAEPVQFEGGRSALLDFLAGGGVLWRHGMTRLARNREGTTLFADGTSTDLATGLAPLAELLCSSRVLDARLLGGWLRNEAAIVLLLSLVSRGMLCLQTG